jgi:hypothetical protein
MLMGLMQIELKGNRKCQSCGPQFDDDLVTIRYPKSVPIAPGPLRRIAETAVVCDDAG